MRRATDGVGAYAFDVTDGVPLDVSSRTSKSYTATKNFRSGSLPSSAMTFVTPFAIRTATGVLRMRAKILNDGRLTGVLDRLSSSSRRMSRND